MSYDIDVFRSYVKAKIDSLYNRYGEGTFEFHTRMKIIYHEVDTRSLHWVKIVAPVFRKALALPEASYFNVSLETFYSEWQALFALPPEATVVEILVQCRSISNTIHNAAQTYFFLSVSMRLKVDTWPYLTLIFQDSANIKRFVDRAFIRIEAYIRSSLNRIQAEIQAENYDQADTEMQYVRQQVESDVKAIVDFTETSYRRIYDASFANYLDVYATDLRYTDACQNLSWFLVDQGFALSWSENEFAPIIERITIVSLSDTDYPGGPQYSKSNFRSIANFNDAGNDSRYLQMSLNTYHLILHEKLLLDIISIFQTFLNNLKNILPQNDASKTILRNLREDAILFAQGFKYLQLYVSQSGLFIDWVTVATVEEYMTLLMKLDLDVIHRIDILCYRAMSIFKRALDYLYQVNSTSQPPTEIPQEQLPVENTNITPREFTDVPLAENPVTGNTNPGIVRPLINAPPSFWMGRRLLNRHGKLPNYIRSTVPYTPTIIPTSGTVELPGLHVPNEGTVDGTLTSNGAEFPAELPQNVTPLLGIGTPQRISSDVFVGKKQPTPQPSAFKPTSTAVQNPITLENGNAPEVIAEVPATVENIPIQTVPTSPIQFYVPSSRFLNEKPFGKRTNVLPRAYQPFLSTPPLVTNPTEIIPEESIVNNEEPILPANNYVGNTNQGSFSSPRSLNEGFFGKRQGLPVSSPETITNYPTVTNPVEMSQGNGGNIVEVTAPVEEVTPHATFVPSPGGLNGKHFGKIEGLPNSLSQPTTYSPSAITPGQIPVSENQFLQPFVVNTNDIPGGEYIPSTINEFNQIPENQYVQPFVVNTNDIPGGEYIPSTVNEFNQIPENQYVQPFVANTNEIPGEYIQPTVNELNQVPENQFVAPFVANTNEIPGEYIQPTVNELNQVAENQYVAPFVANTNEIPGEEYIQPTVNELNQVPENQYVAPFVANTNEIPREEYIQPTVNDQVQPLISDRNVGTTGELTPVNPNTVQEDEFSGPLMNNEEPEEFVPLFRSGNTKPNQEEIAAALDLLSAVYKPVDVNNDGAADLLILNPEEANASLLGGNGQTTILQDQNTDGWRIKESNVEGNGYFDEAGILHDGIMSGTQHEAAEINSNSLDLVDFQSDGTIDMAVENSTNQVLSEDSQIVMLGDLNPLDGLLTNTIVKTSLTTQEKTSMTTYILGENGEPLLQNAQQP